MQAQESRPSSIRGINTNHNSSHCAHSMNSRFNSAFLSSKTLIWKIGWSASASCTKTSSCQIHLSPEHYYKQIIYLIFHNRDIQWTAWAGNQQRGKTWYIQKKQLEQIQPFRCTEISFSILILTLALSSQGRKMEFIRSWWKYPVENVSASNEPEILNTKRQLAFSKIKLC